MPHQNLLSLLVQQALEGVNQLEVGGRGHVVVSLQLQEVARGEVASGGVELLTHGDAPLTLVVTHVNLLQETRGHRRQGVLRPRLETENGINV